MLPPLLLLTLLIGVSRCSEWLLDRPDLVTDRRGADGASWRLTAFRDSNNSGRWASIGRPRLLRSNGWPAWQLTKDGMRVRLRLLSSADAAALAGAASRRSRSPVFPWQMTRLPLQACFCHVAGLTGAAVDLTASPLTVRVEFPSQWNGSVMTAAVVKVATTPVSCILLVEGRTMSVAPKEVDEAEGNNEWQLPLLAAFDFASATPRRNLASVRGEFGVSGVFNVAFDDVAGASFSGNSSRLSVDTRSGRLTEFVKSGSPWSAFVKFRSAANKTTDQPLFSVHNAVGRFLFSASLTASVGSGWRAHASVQKMPQAKLHSQSTVPMLQQQQDSWTTLGIGFNGSDFSFVVNGVATPTDETPDSPSGSRRSSLALRGDGLSIGMVRPGRESFDGDIRCFGLAAQALTESQFDTVLNSYCD